MISKFLQKNNPRRYNVFLDTGTGKNMRFSVDQDVLVIPAPKGMELDDLLLEEITHYDKVSRAPNGSQFLARKHRGGSTNHC